MKSYGNFYEFTDGAAEVLYWVTRPAVSTDIWREEMRMVHVEAGQAICTDGKRMHVIDLPTVNDGTTVKPILDDGDYCIVKRLQKVVQLAKMAGKYKDFPNWKKIPPSDAPVKTFSWIIHPRKSAAKFSISMAEYFRYSEFNTLINFDFIDDLVTHKYGTPWTVEVRTEKENDPQMVVFTSTTRWAYVMPMNWI